MRVWETKLDDKYDVYVERTDERRGRLIVEEGNTKIAEGIVSLSYGAQFGPDIADVADWQTWASNFVDGLVDVGPLKGLE